MNVRWFLVILVIGIAVLTVSLGTKYRPLLGVLPQIADDVEQSAETQQTNEERALTIIEKVRTHFVLPIGGKATVAEIINIDALIAKNDFYIGAENGDYLIVTPERAILYSAKRDVIINIVPIKAEGSGEAAAEVEVKP